MSFKPIDESIVGTSKPVPGGLLQDLALDLKSLADYDGSGIPQQRRACAGVAWHSGSVNETGSSPSSFADTVLGFPTNLTASGFDATTAGLEIASTLEQPQVIPIPFTWPRKKGKVTVYITASIDTLGDLGYGRVFLTAGYALRDGTIRPPQSCDDLISSIPSDRPFAATPDAVSTPTIRIIEAVALTGIRMYAVDVTRDDDSDELIGWVLLAVRTQWRSTSLLSIDSPNVFAVWSGGTAGTGTIDPNFLQYGPSSSLSYAGLFTGNRTGPKPFIGINITATELDVTRRSYHTVLRFTAVAGGATGSGGLAWIYPALPDWFIQGVQSDPDYEFTTFIHQVPIVKIFSITVEETAEFNASDRKRVLSPGSPATESSSNTLADPQLGYFDGPNYTMFPMRVKGGNTLAETPIYTVLEKNEAIYWFSYNDTDYNNSGTLGAGFWECEGWNGLDFNYMMFSTTPSQDVVGTVITDDRFINGYLTVDGDDASNVRIPYPYSITDQSIFNQLYRQLPPNPAFLDNYPIERFRPSEEYLYTGGLHPAALADRTLNLGGIDRDAFSAPRLYPLPGMDIPGGATTNILAGSLPLEVVQPLFTQTPGSRIYPNAFSGDSPHPMVGNNMVFVDDEQIVAPPTDNYLLWYLPTAASRFTENS